MRRLLSLICCLVFAMTIVARGGGMAACAEAGACCAATTAPTTKPADDCCETGDAPKPTTLPARAAVGGEMPCCALVLWMPTIAVGSIGEVVATYEAAPPDAPRSAAAAEPATPPPRPLA